MSASAVERVTVSALTNGQTIRAERHETGLIPTRRTRGIITATVTGKSFVPAGRNEARGRYVLHTDQGDTAPVVPSQTFAVVPAPADVPAAAPTVLCGCGTETPAGTADAAGIACSHCGANIPDAGCTDGATLWRAADLARQLLTERDAPAPERADVRPRVEIFRGRKLRAEKGSQWGTVSMSVNGALSGVIGGQCADALNRAIVQLRADVIAADERRVTDPDAYAPEWYKGAPDALPTSVVLYLQYMEAARLARKCAAPDMHIPGVMGCPVEATECNGIPAGADTIPTEPVNDLNMTGFGELGFELRERLARMLPDVGPVSAGETYWDHKAVRQVATWSVAVNGHTVTTVHYQGRTALTGEASYVAVLIDGQLVDGAGDINAAQTSADLTARLAWTIAEAVRAMPAVAGAVEVDGTRVATVTRIEASGDQGDQGDQGDASPTSNVNATAVPTIDGAPVGMPYVVDAPQDWPGDFPRIESKDVAKLMRATLRAWFPGVKFSVRTDGASMYSAVDVHWSDGPAKSVVELVAGMWAGRRLNGYRGRVLHVDASGTVAGYDLPGAWVNVGRDVTADSIDAAESLLPAGDQVPAGWEDPFARMWEGGPRRDCARWLAGLGVDSWARFSLADGRDGCTVKRCRLVAGHPFPGIHVNDYGTPFFGTPDQGDGGDGGNGGGGGGPVNGGPDDAPAGPGFRTWAELAEHIAGRPAVVEHAPAALPAPALALSVVNTGHVDMRVHARGCRDVAREETRGGSSWDVDTADLRGLVVDLYGRDFEGFDPAEWQNWTGDIEVMPCAGELPDFADDGAPDDYQPDAPIFTPRTGERLAPADAYAALMAEGGAVRTIAAEPHPAPTGARSSFSTSFECPAHGTVTVGGHATSDLVRDARTLHGKCTAGDPFGSARSQREDTPAGQLARTLRAAGWTEQEAEHAARGDQTQADAGAGDDGDDGDQGDEWPEFYTLPVDAYAPQLTSDEPDESGALLTITHDHEGGTRLDGSVKGDGVYEIAKRHGFGWGRTMGIGIKGSRDTFARITQLGKLAAELREAGHRVAFEIDDVWRPASVREEHRAERVSDRVERRAARAGRKFAEGATRREAARSIGDRMPFGEPIKVGHHSERRHRAAFDKIDANYRKSFAAYEYAELLNARNDGAAANERAKRDPRAMMRRIERLEKETRRMRRHLDWLLTSDQGNTSRWLRSTRLEIERNNEDVAYQRAKLGKMAESGEFVSWSREHFRKGDLANVRGRWCEVTRVNAKSVSVADRFGWGGAGTAPWDEIHGRRRDGMQWDSPNAEPWPVADAVKVAKWGELVSDAGRDARGETARIFQNARVREAQRLVLWLDANALDAQVQAFGEPADKAGKRRRALAFFDAYERLTGGESFDDIAATMPACDGPAPRWTVPAGDPVEMQPAQLRIGDIVIGVRTAGLMGSAEHISRSMVGPVTGAPVTTNRHESGEWVTVEVDGETHEVKAWRRVLAHPATR